MDRVGRAVKLGKHHVVALARKTRLDRTASNRDAARAERLAPWLHSGLLLVAQRKKTYLVLLGQQAQQREKAQETRPDNARRRQRG